MSIEGIPEGWVALKFDHSVFGDNWIDEMGQIHLHEADLHSKYKRLIIRKIEKPKTYRPFANAAEYLPRWGNPVKYQDSLKFDLIISTSELGVYIAQGRMVQFLTMEQAFGCLRFADGSPFGVEVTS